MPGKIRLVLDKKAGVLEIHQEGVDIDGMAIGCIHDVAEVNDEKTTRPELSRSVQVVRAYNRDNIQVAWFWRIDIESVEVVE